jgi:hypothetical protein
MAAATHYSPKNPDFAADPQVPYLKLHPQEMEIRTALVRSAIPHSHCYTDPALLLLGLALWRATPAANTLIT